MEYGIFRIPVPEFTLAAFREGLLNAFGHRNYIQLGQVRVLIDDEGMTTSSQGGFIEGSILYGRLLPDYSESTSSIVKLFVPRANPDMQFTKMIADEQNRRDRPLSINALMILSTIRSERRITVERLSEVIHLNKIRTNATIGSLVEAGLIEESIWKSIKRKVVFS